MAKYRLKSDHGVVCEATPWVFSNNIGVRRSYSLGLGKTMIEVPSEVFEFMWEPVPNEKTQEEIRKQFIDDSQQFHCVNAKNASPAPVSIEEKLERTPWLSDLGMRAAAEIRSLRSVIDELHHDLDESRNENACNAGHYTDVESTFQGLREESKNLRDMIADLRKSLQHCEKSLQESYAENERLRKRIEALDASRMKILETDHTLREHIDDLTEQRDALVAGMAAISEALESGRTLSVKEIIDGIGMIKRVNTALANQLAVDCGASDED